MRNHGVFAPATKPAARMLEAMLAGGRGALDAAPVGTPAAALPGVKKQLSLPRMRGREGDVRPAA
jgi:hypothetical protein